VCTGAHASVLYEQTVRGRVRGARVGREREAGGRRERELRRGLRDAVPCCVPVHHDFQLTSPWGGRGMRRVCTDIPVNYEQTCRGRVHDAPRGESDAGREGEKSNYNIRYIFHIWRRAEKGTPR
jgi:hypothetical protein